MTLCVVNSDDTIRLEYNPRSGFLDHISMCWHQLLMSFREFFTITAIRGDWGEGQGSGVRTARFSNEKTFCRWLWHFFERFYFFIHERHTERGRDIGRGRSRLPMGSPVWDSIPGPQDHALNQRQTFHTLNPIPVTFYRLCSSSQALLYCCFSLLDTYCK